MRILRVHNRYQERGGEDVCFDAEIDLLRAYGEDVRTVVVTNDDIPARRTPWTSARLAASTIWSRAGYRLVADAIREHNPDVVHFDNTFPLISPAAYTACRKSDVAVVQTLHNYRLLCPEATFYRNGSPCEDCLGKLIPVPGIIHACYRGSRTETAVVATMIATHRQRRTWSRDVDIYITMTEFERRKFIQGGIPEERIAIKPHFVDVPRPASQSSREGILFVGRLTVAKGIDILLKAWKHVPSLPLTIVGDGPLAGDIATAATNHDGLRYMGRMPSQETYALMGRAAMLVAPTQMYETFGRVAIEAFAQGTPVLASNRGAIGEVVTHGQTGLHFTAGSASDLAAKLSWASTHPDSLARMGNAARREYEKTYTPDPNYRQLMDIYHQAIESAQRRRAHQPTLQP